jgi:DNA-binding response OmpR family regulator
VFVAQLRRKLGDDATDPKLILTHFGLGLRWIAPLG